MSARDVIAKVYSGAPFPSKRTYDRVTDVLDALADAGYVILSPDEVRGMTPGAAEAFATLDLADRLIERAYGTDVPREWNKAFRQVAKARLLKGGRDAQ